MRRRMRCPLFVLSYCPADRRHTDLSPDALLAVEGARSARERRPAKSTDIAASHVGEQSCVDEGAHEEPNVPVG